MIGATYFIAGMILPGGGLVLGGKTIGVMEVLYATIGRRFGCRCRCRFHDRALLRLQQAAGHEHP